MAVPTITSVTPALGHTGGDTLVTVLGTNFRMMDPPPPTGPAGDYIETVRVTFGGVDATNVRVYSATELDCVTPIHDPGAVSVVVTNLNNAGNPIVGETVTLAAAYTFERPTLTQQDGLWVRVVRALRREVARQLLENTVIVTHFDYDPNTGDGLRLIDVAKLPAIVLSDFESTNNREWNQLATRERQTAPLLGVELKYPVFLDLSVKITAVSDFAVELLAIDAAIKAFFYKNRSLQVPKDFNNPAAGQDTFQLDFFLPGKTATSITPRARGTNLGNASGELILRGIPAQEMPGFANEDVLSRTYPVEEILLQVERKPL